MSELEGLRVLIVEDDENKKDRILRYYEKRFSDDCVFWASALVPGLRMAKEVDPDFIILDMTLPNYEASDKAVFNPMRAFGGREFLRQAVRLKLKSKIVVVTQFETFGAAPNIVDLSSLDAELRREFSGRYLGAIYYHASMSVWESELGMVREKLLEGKV